MNKREEKELVDFLYTSHQSVLGTGRTRLLLDPNYRARVTEGSIYLELDMNDNTFFSDLERIATYLVDRYDPQDHRCRIELITKSFTYTLNVKFIEKQPKDSLCGTINVEMEKHLESVKIYRYCVFGDFKIELSRYWEDEIPTIKITWVGQMTMDQANDLVYNLSKTLLSGSLSNYTVSSRLDTIDLDVNTIQIEFIGAE